MEFFLLWIAFAVVAAVVAGSKGRSAFGWFLLGCIFGVFALLFVALLPSKKAADVVAQQERPTPETHVRCPACKELVRRDATLCKHCRSTLQPS